VQAADPTTGISWDGKSKIVYTYADGSTGTTPKDGAKYEVTPGIYGTYHAPKEEVNTTLCDYCGKVAGDGTNGTCVNWPFAPGDTICEHCGTAVPPKTCHTCK